MMRNNSKTILLLGGGTGGPTLPLIAVAEEMRKADLALTIALAVDKSSVVPENAFPEWLTVYKVPTAKLPRFATWKLLLVPFQLLHALYIAATLLWAIKPALMIGAGSYTEVPFAWLSWLTGSKVHLHQQDVRATLSNVLSKPFANSFTVTWDVSVNDFPHAEVTGNPVRLLTHIDKTEALTKLGLENKTWVLITGGGSGAARINQILTTALPELQKENVGVLHLTGGKDEGLPPDSEFYKQWKFFSDMGLLYSAVSLVVTRAGVSTLAETSEFGLPSIVIPMPNTHQENNAAFAEHMGASVYAHEPALTPEKLTKHITEILRNPDRLRDMSGKARLLVKKNAAHYISTKALKLLT